MATSLAAKWLQTRSESELAKYLTTVEKMIPLITDDSVSPDDMLYKMQEVLQEWTH